MAYLYGPVMNIGFTEHNKIFLYSNNNIPNYKDKLAPIIRYMFEKVIYQIKLKRNFYF